MVATQDIEATVIGQARTWDARPMVRTHPGLADARDMAEWRFFLRCPCRPSARSTLTASRLRRPGRWGMGEDSRNRTAEAAILAGGTAIKMPSCTRLHVL
jgi:hypothetical protein